MKSFYKESCLLLLASIRVIDTILGNAELFKY